MNLDQQMAILFVEEAAELLADFEQALLLLESLPDDVELLGRIFRCAHTLKGNAKMLGFEQVAVFTHQLENLLDKLRRQELVVTRGVANTLFASLDMVKSLVGEVAGGPAHDVGLYTSTEARIEALVADLQRELDPVAEPAPLQLPGEHEQSRAVASRVTSTSAGSANAREVPPPLEALPTAAPADREGTPRAEPPRRATPPAAIEQAAGGEHSDPAQAPRSSPGSRAEEAHASTLGGLVDAAARPASDTAPVETRSAPASQAVQPAESVARTAKDQPPAFRERRVTEGEANSVRVPIEKLDRLINLTGEVVIAQSMIAQLVTDLTPDSVSSLQELVAQMERHCRELQERMLGARMLPIKSVFARFNRMVRDLSAASGKSIVLEVSGEDTELDKTVIEKIADPLTHLVRNAIDHGIETPDGRRASGKPEQAVLRLAAYQKGGSIFIDVSDDGRGLNRDKILAKARQTGLVRADEQPSDDEIHALIFAAGFSTADQVTEISGRGVGMDVVRRNVESLKGSITILSTPGRGTTFRVKLPLTLAILDGLGLRVGGQVYLVPLVAVIESLQPPAQDVRRVANLGEVVDVRGEYLPLVRLYELFGITPVYPDAHQGLVMVIDDGAQKIALQIDELIGQYQVVIKSLEANFQAVPGISGATVLGDGRVALILDTANLAGLARSHERHVLTEQKRAQRDAVPMQTAIGSQP